MIWMTKILLILYILSNKKHVDLVEILLIFAP